MNAMGVPIKKINTDRKIFSTQPIAKNDSYYLAIHMQ